MASPTDGQANTAVCLTIAKALKLPPSAVSVIQGQTSRNKALQIEGITEDEAMQRLKAQ